MPQDYGQWMLLHCCRFSCSRQCVIDTTAWIWTRTERRQIRSFQALISKFPLWTTTPGVVPSLSSKLPFREVQHGCLNENQGQGPDSIFLGSVYLVLNTRTGHIYPQYHVVFYGKLYTVDHMMKVTVPGNWKNLVEEHSDLARHENFALIKEWHIAIMCV